jgi:hypothetical protein
MGCGASSEGVVVGAVEPPAVLQDYPEVPQEQLAWAGSELKLRVPVGAVVGELIQCSDDSTGEIVRTTSRRRDYLTMVPVDVGPDGRFRTIVGGGAHVSVEGVVALQALVAQLLDMGYDRLACEAALARSPGAGRRKLDAALQLLLDEPREPAGVDAEWERLRDFAPPLELANVEPEPGRREDSNDAAEEAAAELPSPAPASSALRSLSAETLGSTESEPDPEPELRPEPPQSLQQEVLLHLAASAAGSPTAPRDAAALVQASAYAPLLELRDPLHGVTANERVQLAVGCAQSAVDPRHEMVQILALVLARGAELRKAIARQRANPSVLALDRLTVEKELVDGMLDLLRSLIEQKCAQCVDLITESNELHESAALCGVDAERIELSTDDELRSEVDVDELRATDDELRAELVAKIAGHFLVEARDLAQNPQWRKIPVKRMPRSLKIMGAALVMVRSQTLVRSRIEVPEPEEEEEDDDAVRAAQPVHWAEPVQRTEEEVMVDEAVEEEEDEEDDVVVEEVEEAEEAEEEVSAPVPSDSSPLGREDVEAWQHAAVDTGMERTTSGELMRRTTSDDVDRAIAESLRVQDERHEELDLEEQEMVRQKLRHNFLCSVENC